MLKGLSRGALLIIGVVAVVFLISIAGVFGTALYSKITADTRGETGVRENTVADPDYRIAAYEEFYDRCAEIQSYEQQIENMEAGAAGLPKEQVATNLLALRNQRSAAIESYNADSRKAGTLAQFKASDLPYEIDPNQEDTEC